MYWILRDIDSIRNQADGESEHATRAEGRAVRNLRLEEVFGERV